MAAKTPEQITEDLLRPLGSASGRYWSFLALFGGVVVAALCAFGWQVYAGIGVAGKSARNLLVSSVDSPGISQSATACAGCVLANFATIRSRQLTATAPVISPDPALDALSLKS